MSKEKIIIHSFFFISREKNNFSLLYAYICYCSFLLFYCSSYCSPIKSSAYYAYRQYAYKKNMSVFRIDLFTDSDAILKILSVDFCGKVKVNSDSPSKTVYLCSQADLQTF